MPCQTSADFRQRGNFHYPAAHPDASKGKLVCADLRKGAGSYVEFVVKVEEPGDHQISITASAQGPCALSTAPVVNDARQADAGYPMKELLRIERSKPGKLETVSAQTVRFDQVGLHLLRFSSLVPKQLLQIDRIRFKNLQ